MMLSTKEASARLDICKQCERYFKYTSTCRECGCFMIIKTQVATASCPIDKWSKANGS